MLTELTKKLEERNLTFINQQGEKTYRVSDTSNFSYIISLNEDIIKK